MARLRSLTPRVLVTARPARVCRWRAVRHNFVSGKTRVMLVRSHSVDAPDIDCAVCRGHESGCGTSSEVP